MLERSDVWCTNCEGTFMQEMDLSLNGNHEIMCPLCQHVHYRVVKDGVVTEERYRSSGAGPIIRVFTSTANTSSTTFTMTYSGSFLQSSWLNTTTGS